MQRLCAGASQAAASRAWSTPAASVVRRVCLSTPSQVRPFSSVGASAAPAANPSSAAVLPSRQRDVATMAPKEVLQQIVQESTPSMVNNTWRKPRLSKRQIADLRKEFRRHGCEFPQLPKPAGWTAPNKPWNKKPKGHKFEHEREARQKKIEQNMAQMDKWIAEEKQKKFLDKVRARKSVMEVYYPMPTRKPYRPPTKRQLKQMEKS